MKKQAGMTLIELVIVIIVLGIIAAVAAPKFADVSGSAKDAGMKGTEGAFASAYTIAAAKAGAAPTIQNVADQVDGFTFTGPNVWTSDLDGDATADVTVTASDEDTCTPTGAVAVGDTLASYRVQYTLSDATVINKCIDV